MILSKVLDNKVVVFVIIISIKVFFLFCELVVFLIEYYIICEREKGFFNVNLA